jgi:preprotein translocase subunit SecA
MNKQRENVYTLRRELLEGTIKVSEDETLDTRGYLMSLAEDLSESLVATHADKEGDPDLWTIPALVQAVSDLFGLPKESVEALQLDTLSPDEMVDAIYDLAVKAYEEKERLLPVDASILRRVERDFMLQIVDAQWKDHLYSLDHLKEGIGLRGYGQMDPLVEYKKESFDLFQAMKDRIDEEMVRYLWRLRPVIEATPNAPEADAAAAPIVARPAPRRPVQTMLSGGSATAVAPARSATATAAPPRPARTGGDDVVKTVRRDEPKIGRNDPCWCGSGKKFKKCHGA